jgi:hypothetical protein
MWNFNFLLKIAHMEMKESFEVIYYFHTEGIYMNGEMHRTIWVSCISIEL